MPNPIAQTTRRILLVASKCKHGAISVRCPKCKCKQLLSQDEDDWFEFRTDEDGHIYLYPEWYCRASVGGKLCLHGGTATIYERKKTK